MWFFKLAYAAMVLLAGFGSVAAATIYPESELMHLAAGQAALALLTFPLGFIASALGAAIIYTGYATPIEACAGMTLLHAILGYVQWFGIFPAVYGKGAR